MNPKNLRQSVAAALGGAVVVATLFVGAAFAFAQDGGESAPVADTPAEVDPPRPDLFGDRLDLTDEDVADVLAEIEEQALGLIDDAVTSGRITEEQGDALKGRVGAFSSRDRLRFDPDMLLDGVPFELPDFFGTLPEGFEFGLDHFPFGPLPEGFEFEGYPFDLDSFGDFDLMAELEGLAEGLGTTVEELREQFESGMSLDDVLDDLGIDRETLVAETLEQAIAKIDGLVADGVLSQDQADSIKELLDRFGSGEGFPFDLHDFDFDFGEFEFDMDGFRGHDGHGFGFDFFGDGDDGVAEESNAAEALLDV
ncbi:MAG: hypothetical protein U9N84_00890 [Actinomycetota bacterium]|nr:hypothetical protein [Actinomycetota bacterium]